MPTRRALLVSAALAPLSTTGSRVAEAQIEGQIEVPGEAPAETSIATPQANALPDLTGVTPLPLTGERQAAFAAYVAEKLAAAAIPGAAVAVVQGGAVAFLEGFGVRQFGRPRAMPPGQVSRWSAKA